MARKLYKKALVIGAGSGRDMASAVLISEQLRKAGTKVDLAGFLTPWALHRFKGKIEQPINPLIRESTKFIPSKEQPEVPTFFEPRLLGLNEKLDLGIGTMYVFSLQYGTRRLKTELERLAAANGYDLILAVDIGGDILARKEDFPGLLTPIVDFSCLSILSELQAKADIQLSIVSPGVDGEIPHPKLVEIFAELQLQIPFQVSQFTKDSEALQKFLALNQELNKQTGGFSKTADAIEKTLDAKDSFQEPYKRVLRLGKRTIKLPFTVELGKEFFGKIFQMDLRAFAQLRKEFLLKYDSILEAYAEVKRRGAVATEIDFSHVPLSMEKPEEGIFMFTNVPGKVREEALRYFLELN